MVKHKLLIIEEHAILRLGLSTLLRTEPDLDVIAEYSNLSQALPALADIAPDLVITDFHAAEINTLKEQCKTSKILILTSRSDEETIRTALRSGVGGYMLKDADSREILTAVRSMLTGNIYLSPGISDKVIHAFLVKDKSSVEAEKQPLHLLTNRELEILQRVAEGSTSRLIAKQLNLSIKTVEKHRSNLMRKLDLHNASALTVFAIGHGLLNTQD